MKIFNFSHYKLLVNALLIDTLNSFTSYRNRNKPVSNEISASLSSNTKKILKILLSVAVCAILIAYLVMMIVVLTQSAIINNSLSEIPYFIVGMGQLLVIFLGTGAIFNILYFSTDNVLLQSLPVSEATVFAAKFTVAYLSQLFISVLLLMPSLVTFGVVASQAGVELFVGYYVYAIITPFVAPLIPMLGVALISVPVMYLMSLAKNRELAKKIFTIALSLSFLAIYFVFIFSTTGMDYSDTGTITELPSAINSIAKFALLNYFWLEAMVGNSVFLNTLYYCMCLIGAIVFIILLNKFVYKKAVSFSLEEGISRNKKIRTQKNIKENTFIVSFFKKDVKVILSEPTLLMSMALGIVLIPVFMFIGSGSMFSGFSDNIYSCELYSLGFMSYFTVVMMCATNYDALLGVSLEGRNFALIKTLPIKITDFVKCKLLVSNLYNLILSVEFFIVGAIISKIQYGPLIALLNAFIIFVFGFGMTCYGLYNDLKKPTLIWENMQKLTKNNFRVVKPMLIAMGVGILYLVAAILFGILLVDKIILAFSIYFIVFAVVSFTFAGLAFVALWKNKELLFTKIEC